MRVAQKGKSPDAGARHGAGRAMGGYAAHTYRLGWRCALAALILAGQLTLAGEVHAHGIKCAHLMQWLDELAEPPYGEKLIDAGMGGLPIAHIENRETGTWTLLRVEPDGVACLIAYGKKLLIAGDPPA